MADMEEEKGSEGTTDRRIFGQAALPVLGSRRNGLRGDHFEKKIVERRWALLWTASYY